jgi:hypothetical protein
MRSTNSASKEVSALTVLLKKPSTTADLAVDALVEFIWGRRRNGWSLYDVTLSLIELMQEVGETGWSGLCVRGGGADDKALDLIGTTITG